MTEENVGKAAWVRSGAVDPGMRLLTSQLFDHLHALLDNNSFYTFEDDKLLERIAVEPLQFTDSAFRLVFSLLSHAAVEPLSADRSAVEHPMVIELDDKVNGVRVSATLAYAGPFSENHRPLVYRAEAPWLGSLHSSSVKKR